MQSSILVTDGLERWRVQVDYQATSIPGVVITKWHQYGNWEGFALTHLRSGRCCNRRPMTAREINSFVEELGECNIDWDRITDQRDGSAQKYFVDRLTPRAMRMGQGVED